MQARKAHSLIGQVYTRRNLVGTLTRMSNLDQLFREAGRFAEDHGLHHAPWASLVAARQYTRLFQTIQRYAPPGATVLDWGSGFGISTYVLIRLGYKVKATDFVVAPTIDSLRKMSPDFEFTVAEDRSALPYDDASVDLVASIGVLEHVREGGGDERRSLLEIRRTLRNGGRFVCYHFPNRSSWIDAVGRYLGQGAFHPYLYSASDIFSLFNETGFLTDSVTRYGVVPRNHLGRGRRGDDSRFANAVDRLDRVLTLAINPVAQNWGIVARPVNGWPSRLADDPIARAWRERLSATSV
jgi:SAM-dependent methyltransferase